MMFSTEHYDRQRQQPQNVVPFRGEFYPQPQIQPEVKIKSTSAMTPFFAVVCLLAGLALGAIAVYQSVDQSELRELKAQSQQFNQVKQEICR